MVENKNEVSKDLKKALQALEQAKELAYAEVISYNKKNLARELRNESRQYSRQHGRTKRREGGRK